MGGGATHVIGAGMAGLSAATALVEQGRRVHVYESVGHAGGRCRSFHDDQLGCVIDNGNHLMLSGNRSIQDYIRRTGAQDHLVTAEHAAFPFMNVTTGERWTLDLGRGQGMWRLLMRRLGVPGVTRRDALSALRFRQASASATVFDQLGRTGAIYHRLWEPLSMAVLNTESESAMAAAMWPVIKETLGVGPDGCRPVIAKESLSHALVEPARGVLRKAGTDIRFNASLKAMDTRGDRITALRFNNQTIEIGSNDTVILALPIAGVNALMPAVQTPDDFRPIVNAHFRLPHKTHKLTLIGLICGEAHWIFHRGNIASVTVSAATSLINEPTQDIAERLWRDVSAVLQLNGGSPGACQMGPFRIIKEKRATFAQTPDQNRRRPTATTDFHNLFLAGDWIATGLPATIEGAVRSGMVAADLCHK